MRLEFVVEFSNVTRWNRFSDHFHLIETLNVEMRWINEIISQFDQIFSSLIDEKIFSSSSSWFHYLKMKKVCSLKSKFLVHLDLTKSKFRLFVASVGRRTKITMNESLNNNQIESIHWLIKMTHKIFSFFCQQDVFNGEIVDRSISWQSCANENIRSSVVHFIGSIELRISLEIDCS